MYPAFFKSLNANFASFFFQFATLAVLEENEAWVGLHGPGTGIWCGICIIIAGVLGCCAASEKTKALVSISRLDNIAINWLYVVCYEYTDKRDRHNYDFLQLSVTGSR